MIRTIKRADSLLIGLCLTVALASLSVTLASAHAYLAESTPRNGERLDFPPTEVIAKYTQELDSSESQMAVFDVNGSQVDNGDGSIDLFDPDHKTLNTTLKPNLPNGTYTVEWVTKSVEDGDTTEGAFVFTVGDSQLIAVPNAVTESRTDNESPLSLLVVIIPILLLLFAATFFVTRYSGNSTGLQE